MNQREASAAVKAWAAGMLFGDGMWAEGLSDADLLRLERAQREFVGRLLREIGLSQPPATANEAVEMVLARRAALATPYTDTGMSVEPWVDDRDADWDDDFCDFCGGEGGQEGSDIAPYYDFGWIDPTAWIKCIHCNGSGMKRTPTPERMDG